MRTPLRLLAPLALLLLAACTQEEPDWKKIGMASCESDDTCANGFICVDGKCAKGQRSKEELAAKKAAEEKARKAAMAPKGPKAGEGQLRVRICPFFKNTMEAIGTLVATHESGKKHYIHLARETPEMGYQDVFMFESLPVGKYEISANYGIQVKGVPDISDLKCHEKVAKKECKDGTLRLVEVAAGPAPALEKDKDGKESQPPCDFTAE